MYFEEPSWTTESETADISPNMIENSSGSNDVLLLASVAEEAQEEIRDLTDISMSSSCLDKEFQ